MLRSLQVFFTCLVLALVIQAQTMQAPDITKTPTLYVVPYAHLDTQWRWEFPQTISEFLLKTMRVNFDLIEKYPHYVFNLRVPICKGGLSGCQTGSFDSGKVQAVAEEFDKDYGFGGSCEKLRKGMAEGNGDDLFGGCQSWPNGSNPGAE